MRDQPAADRGASLPFPPVPTGRTRADLDRFWTDWEPVIRRVAGSKLRLARVPRGLAEADDAVQHVYLQVHERWQRSDFAGADPGRVVLGAILTDFIRAQVKELKNRQNRPGRDGDRNEPANDQATLEPGPDDLLIQQEVERYLREALDQLPRLQRQAVEMSVEGELSREAIADRMGVRAGTVSSHRARGLRKLADVLSPIVMSIGMLLEAIAHSGLSSSLGVAAVVTAALLRVLALIAG